MSDDFDARLEQELPKLKLFQPEYFVTHWEFRQEVRDLVTRLLRERDHTEEAPKDVMDALHAVFTRNGIASYTDYPHLAGDVVHWACEMYRQSKMPAENARLLRERDEAISELAQARAETIAADALTTQKIAEIESVWQLFQTAKRERDEARQAFNHWLK